MFMVLTVAEQSEGRWQRLRRTLSGKDLVWQSGSYGGNRYLHVTWYGNAADIPWGRIAAITNRPRVPMLLPPGVVCPPGCPVRAYEPQDFEARLVVAAVCQSLREQPAAAHRGTVGIIDPQGIAAWAASELAACCRGIMVYSLRPERYRNQEQWLMEQTGLPLQYASTPSQLKDCLLCAAPYPAGVFTVPAPVICADRSGIQARPTINRLTLHLSPEIHQAIPAGVSPEHFLGMVTEIGQRRIEQELLIEMCRIDGRLAPLSDLAKMAANRDLT